MRRLASAWIVSLSVVTIVGVLAIPGVAQDRGAALVMSGEPPAFFLMYTGDVIGYIEDCGCKKNPSGGLARRAWVVEQVTGKYPGTPQLLVDSGNFSGVPSPQGKTRTQALLDGMSTLGYRVVNVGERDVRQGYAGLMEMLGERDVPLVSSNLVDHRSREPVFPPYRVVEAVSPDGQASLRIGVVGVMRYNPIFRKPGPDGGELAIVHPVDPVKAAVAELEAADVDAIVLLAALHRDDAERIATEVPQIDFVVGSYGGHYTSRQDRVGETWLLYSGNQGKRFGETRVFTDGDGEIVDQQTRMHFLTKMYPSQPAMLEFVDSVPSVSDEVAAEQTAEVGIDLAAIGGPYTGSAACKQCHASEYAAWETTSHAHAFDTLAEHKERASCRACHTVASGIAGGFVSVEATPELASVGCESCHGAGRDHVKEPRSRYGTVGLSTCTACHDRKNSPKFDYYSYVARVNHQASP